MKQNMYSSPMYYHRKFSMWSVSSEHCINRDFYVKVTSEYFHCNNICLRIGESNFVSLLFTYTSF